MTGLSRGGFLRAAGAMALSAGAVRGGAVEAREDVAARIADAAIRAHPELEHLAIAVGVVAGGGPGRLYFAGAPVAARNHAQPRALNATTPFLIGSITKVFTTRIYAMRQGSFERRLGEVLPLGLPERLAAVPVRALANYGSGFPTDNHPPIWWRGTLDVASLPALVASLRAHPDLPPCAPEAAYSYSNFAFGLLGLAALGLTDLAHPVAPEAHAAVAALGRRLGLSAATAPWTAASAELLPAGYTQTGLVPQRDDYGAPNWLVLGGGGNLVSTPADMLTWLAYNMGRTGTDEAVLVEAQSAPITFRRRLGPMRGVGACTTEPIAPIRTSLGWFHAEPSRFGVATLTKNGGVKGFSSWMGFEDWVGTGSPSPLGVVALANAPHIADRVGMRVYRSLVRR